MTEEEAKTKWCPFVRMIAGKIADDGKSEHRDGTTPFNRIVDGENGRYAYPRVAGCCIGSACMAWRYSVEGLDKTTEEMRKGYPGYCGLAGKP